MKHNLKILPSYFDAILYNGKNFEIRDNSDRGFQKRDHVLLREYEPGKNYTGRKILAEISYVTGYEQKDNYVVFGLKDIEVIDD